MKINKTYKFRLYPDKIQEQKLLQQSGNSRFLWNKLVEFNQQYNEKHKLFPTQSTLQVQIKELKKEYEFLKSTYSQPLQINAKRLYEVNKKALKPEIISKRKLKIAKASKANKERKSKALKKAFAFGFACFKKKSDMNGSLFYPQHFKICKSRIHFPKLDWIKYIKHREIEGKPKTCTITQDGIQWYVSICCEVIIKDKVQPDIKDANIVGIDVGIKDFATFSDGTVIKNPRTLKKYAKKLKREQHKLSKKEFVEKEINNKTQKVSSNNRNKQKEKVRRVYRKIRNTRKDFLHKTSNHIITKYDGVALETLNIQEMLLNKLNTKKSGKEKKVMNRNIHDVSWYDFSIMLEYKSLWNNKYFHKIDKYFASTKTCFKCKHKQEMTLDQRTYSCNNCKTVIDRDLNAALNIKEEGISCMKDINTTAGTVGSYACGQVALATGRNKKKDDRIQAIKVFA